MNETPPQKPSHDELVAEVNRARELTQNLGRAQLRFELRRMRMHTAWLRQVHRRLGRGQPFHEALQQVYGRPHLSPTDREKVLIFP